MHICIEQYTLMYTIMGKILCIQISTLFIWTVYVKLYENAACIISVWGCAEILPNHVLLLYLSQQIMSSQLYVSTEHRKNIKSILKALSKNQTQVARVTRLHKPVLWPAHYWGTGIMLPWQNYIRDPQILIIRIGQLSIILKIAHVCEQAFFV